MPLLALTAFLQDDTQAAPGLGDMLPMLAIMFFIMWFLVIRPERKERRRREEMIEQIKKNDRVLTTGGMFATVAAVGEKELTIKFDDGPTRVRVVRSAIASVVNADGSAAGGDDDADSK